MPAKALLIDISDTLVRNREPVPSAVRLVRELRESGLTIYLVSNNEYQNVSLEPFAIPANQILNPRTVGGDKGTGRFVGFVCEEEELSSNEVLYLGDTNLDMREAANGGVLFLRAGWSENPNQSAYGMLFPNPIRAIRGIKAWFRKEKPWYYTLNGVLNGSTFHYRALLDPGSANITGIKNLLKNRIDNLHLQEQEGNAQLQKEQNLQKHLTGNLIASSYLEGLFNKDHNGKRPLICIYPGHGGPQTGPLDRFAAVSGQLFAGTFFVRNLLVRHQPAVKSAYARVRGEEPTIQNQLSTIVLNEEYREMIVQRRILVFDDFTTAGFSFETARLQLLNAGASEVYCISVGKFRPWTNIFSPRYGVSWDSFLPNSLSEDMLISRYRMGEFDQEALDGFTVPLNLVQQQGIGA